MKKEDEIEKLKKCLKNKEKRLKKIEERFKIRNSILWFVGWTFVCFFWVVYLVYNIENIDIELLEKSLSEFDYLFQEGVVFEEEEINKLKGFLEQFNKILNDEFFNQE